MKLWEFFEQFDMERFLGKYGKRFGDSIKIRKKPFSSHLEKYAGANGMVVSTLDESGRVVVKLKNGKKVTAWEKADLIYQSRTRNLLSSIFIN